MESVGVKLQNNGVVKTDDERIELHEWRTITIKITENTSQFIVHIQNLEISPLTLFLPPDAWLS